MSTKQVAVLEGVLTERAKDGSKKLVPKLGPDGKQIKFNKLVLEPGQLHQGDDESAEQYAERMAEIIEDIDGFYSDFSREDCPSIEGLCNYGMDLVARPNEGKTSHKEANRMAFASFMAKENRTSELVPELMKGTKSYNKWVDQQVSLLGTKIPGVILE